MNQTTISHTVKHSNARMYFTTSELVPRDMQIRAKLLVCTWTDTKWAFNRLTHPGQGTFRCARGDGWHSWTMQEIPPVSMEFLPNSGFFCSGTSRITRFILGGIRFFTYNPILFLVLHPPTYFQRKNFVFCVYHRNSMVYFQSIFLYYTYYEFLSGVNVWNVFVLF
jgi:hypothetical protein